MCHENTPTPIHQQQPALHGRMDPILIPNPDPTIQMAQQKWRRIRPGNVFCYCQNFASFSFLLSVVFSCCSPSASWFNMLWIQSALLHTLVVMSGYLNYSCFAISPKQSAHSPLTCGSILAQRTATHRIFCLFQTILRKPQEMPVFGKSPVISNF